MSKITLGKKGKAGITAAVCALGVLVAAVALTAYFTDVQSNDNVFVSGEIELSLDEGGWDDNSNYVDPTDDYPDGYLEDCVPNATYVKEPTVTNEGTSEAFVFLTVEVPYELLYTVTTDGETASYGLTQLFSRTGNADNAWTDLNGNSVNGEWKLVTIYDNYDGSTVDEVVSGNKIANSAQYDVTDEDEFEDGTFTYVYAYADDYGYMTALAAGSTTTTLFDTITYANVYEDQGLENSTRTVTVTSYGIQTTELGDTDYTVTDSDEDETEIAAVWAILYGQVNALAAIESE